LRNLHDALHRRLDEQLPGGVALNGHPTQRLPNTANLALPPYTATRFLRVLLGWPPPPGPPATRATRSHHQS
jgi:hypothetical protein